MFHPSCRPLGELGEVDVETVGMTLPSEDPSPCTAGDDVSRANIDALRAGGVQPCASLVGRMSEPSIEQLAMDVRRSLEETHAEYAQMPFFIRPLVRRGFIKRTGFELAAWLQLLDAAARGEPTAVLSRSLPALATHFDGAPSRAKRGMGARPDELIEVERRARTRAASVRALLAALGG